MELKWYMFHPYEFLNDIHHRFVISFGYFQCSIRDSNRINGMSARPSNEWEPIAKCMAEINQRTKFRYKLKLVNGRITAVPRGFPKWYDDFIPQVWNSHF